MTKSVFGLLLTLALFSSAVYLKIYHGFGDAVFGLILAFGLVVGVLVAFSDRIMRFKFAGSEIELAKKEIDTAGKKAIGEIEARLDRVPKEYWSKMIDENGNMYMGGDVCVDEEGRRYIEDTREGEKIRVYEKREPS